jgi:hypothetical protein
VDADEETLEDLLEGCEDEEPHAHDGELRPDAEEALELEENDGFDDPEYLTLVHECECMLIHIFPIVHDASLQQMGPGHLRKCVA